LNVHWLRCLLNKTQQVLKEKLDVNVSTGWINKIKAEFREDARKEYYRLLTDNFSYKYLTMEVMLHMHEIIKQQREMLIKIRMI